MWVDVTSMCVEYLHASVPAATRAATCWAWEQFPRYWKPVQLHRATPSRTVTSLNSPGLLLLAMRTTRSRDRRRRRARGGRGPADRAFRPTGQRSVPVLERHDRFADVPTWAVHPAR